ncbi:MAG: ribonuclease Z [Gemmatimonadota bacterium]|jgi:ribonuclease Z|nr:ribonuclease Z [Gemmatimonadota bacterium]MDQ8152656.1 ribonuclease Z [Gemmatimonadota bacterium]MDQ8169361.1 ribonuclease Z [Gemmatimonadota bacterium]MDQ8174315.1 ribonuclease Z [Gemmatimonadota bacterium]
MSLSLTFLGTSASRPTVERGVSSIALTREGETMLFDCGEGTQRQMMRYGVGFTVGDVFFTHFHTDHYLGALGLLKTLALQGREEPLRLWGPRGAQALFKRAEGLGNEKLTYPLIITEVEPDTPILRKGYSIRPFAVEHRQGAAVGYALVEHERLGRFDPEHAKTLGIPEGPLWGKIHKGESVTLPDGRVIAPSALVGPTRPGRTVVLTGDTRPCAATIQASHQADLLVHEATFGDEEAPRAAETMHSTAREAGTVAQMAKVRTLVLTHFSARYSRDASDLGREAREAFTGELLLAKDGLTVDVPFRDAAGNTTAE